MPLLKELLVMWIDHDRWKTLERHRHEKELLRLQLNLKSEDDDEFNLETSNGACADSSKGNISRTRVKRGAVQRAKEIGESDLYATLLHISWCGKRSVRWPTANDYGKAVEALRQEFRHLQKSNGLEEILRCIDRIPDWDGCLVEDEMKAIKEEIEERERSKIINSPLFKAFHKSYPDIDPDDFNREYGTKGGNFTQTAVYLLRERFKKNQPPEVKVVSMWSQSWLQYLPTYQEKWLKDLRSLELRVKAQQKAWEESIS